MKLPIRAHASVGEPREKSKREKRPRIDWQVKPTHRRRAATATAASGENVIGCGEEYREIFSSVIVFLDVLGC